MKKSPRGFYAVCQCGVSVGALDYQRTERKDAGRILGRWLHDGCKVVPYFDDLFSINIKTCNCEDKK